MRSNLRFAGLSSILDRNLVVLAGGEFLTRVLTFVAFAHLARRLSPDVFGKVELALAFLMFGNLTVELGYKTLGAKSVAQQPECVEWLVRRILTSQLVIAGLLLIGTVSLGMTLPLDPILAQLLIGYAVSLLLVPFFLNWVFQGQQRMVWITIPQVVRQSLFGAAALLLVRAPQDVSMVPFMEIISVAVAALIGVGVYLKSGFRLSLDVRTPWDRALFLASVPIGISQLIWALRNYAPIILLGILASETAVGLFGAAMRIVLALQVGVMVYWTNFYPKLSKYAQQSGPELRRQLFRSLVVLTLPLALLAFPVTFLSGLAMRTVFGAAFADPDASLSLAVLVWVVPITAWRSHPTYALFVFNRQTVELKCSLVGVCLLLALAAFLTPAFGIVGMAWSMVISELVGAGLVSYVWRQTAAQLGND